jgi:hypothetical protein
MSAGPLNSVTPDADPLSSDATLLATAVSAELGRARASSRPQ